jgi:hypothetical protein
MIVKDYLWFVFLTNIFKNNFYILYNIMWNCKIYHNIGESTSMTLHNKDYKCLKEISEDLGLTYQQVADLSSRKEKKKYQQFKYFPEIKIVKLTNQKISN